MNRIEWELKLRESHGGPWLGEARNLLQCRAMRGEYLTWGSQDLVTGLTVRDIEDMAIKVAAAALAAYEKELNAPKCTCKWDAANCFVHN
jgi:hypothetical protein